MASTRATARRPFRLVLHVGVGPDEAAAEHAARELVDLVRRRAGRVAALGLFVLRRRAHLRAGHVQRQRLPVVVDGGDRARRDDVLRPAGGADDEVAVAWLVVGPRDLADRRAVAAADAVALDAVRVADGSGGERPKVAHGTSVRAAPRARNGEFL